MILDIVEADWRDPLALAAAWADEPWILALLSDGDADRGRWSYLMRRPTRTLTAPAGSPGQIAALADLLGAELRQTDPAGPPFQGGIAGLMGYAFGDAPESRGLSRLADWPDLAFGRYESLLAFDHLNRKVLAIGPEAPAWLDDAGDLARPAARSPATERPPAGDYEAKVAGVVARIAAGEIFQANVARAWRGRLRPPAEPFDVALALFRASPAPFAAWMRLPGRALLSNSPERFIRVRPEHGDLVAETRPIKGTAPRGTTPEADRALACGLAASAKDRAENLMIVDLMRNDLARVCRPGTVRTPDLFRVESYSNVHHLVSTVTGRLQADRTALDLIASAFPPGSITGAPKIQAMRVIDALEPARGPFFGAMAWAGFDGALDSSVLIRTAGFVEDADGWRWEARAGAGLVADSDPAGERAETDVKISALLAALGAAD